MTLIKERDDVKARYTDALRSYLQTSGEEALATAFALGREMIARRGGVMELAAVHTDAVVKVLPELETRIGCATVATESARLLCEGLSSFEMLLFGFREKNDELSRLTEALESRVAERTRDLRDAERRAHAIIEHSPVVLYARRFPPTDSFEYLSPQVKNLLGATAHELTPAALEERIHEADRERVSAARLSLTEAGQTFSLEYRVIADDGSVLWLRDQGHIVENAPHLMLHGVLSDVTRERELSEQLQRTQKLEALGRLAGGVAHDFNNLLQIISSFTGFVLDDLGRDDPRAADLKEVLNAANSGAALVGQLLAFSRQRLREPVSVDVNEALVRLDKIMRRSIGQGVHISVVLESDVSTVLMDPSQLDQVLLNLAANARDALVTGGSLELASRLVEIERGSVIELPPGEYVEVTVADDGVGMSEETRRRVFEPFFTTKGRGGTGLGLASSMGIARGAGGTILVESEENKGSTFRLLLPHTKNAASLPVALAPTPFDDLIIPGGILRVLLVEDYGALRHSVHRILISAGAEVTDSVTAEEALEHLRARPDAFDLVLSDVALPGMSGRQLVMKVREMAPHVKVLLISGFVEVEDAHELKGVPFLPKPFTPGQLLGRILSLLSQVDPPSE